MAAHFSRTRTSRRETSPSGWRRGIAVVALTGGVAGFATLGIAAVTNPVQAAPKGNNGTIKIAQSDPDGTPDNNPHVGCTFNIEWYNFDNSSVTAHVSFAPQAPTSGATYAVSGDTSPTFTGGPGFDHSEPYTLSPSGADPQPQQGYHVKVTVTTPNSKGNDTKSKVFWFGPCAVQTTPPDTTPPTDDTTPPDTTPPTDDTTPPDTTPPTDDTTIPTQDTTPPCDTVTVIPRPAARADDTCDSVSATPPTEPGSATIPPTEPGRAQTSDSASSSPEPGDLSSTSTSPAPGAVVPTRIESGLATLPTASTQHGSADRWPLFALSGMSALLGAAGLFPRRRGAKRS